MSAEPQEGSVHAPARRAAFVFIFITLLLDMMALGLIMPILPKLVASFVNDDAIRDRISSGKCAASDNASTRDSRFPARNRIPVSRGTTTSAISSSAATSTP